jgi:WhiB family transcriptional regulator, redox-sensing transcriptional regulator
MIERREWQDQAGCLGADPELFFPVSEFGPSSEQIGAAKQVCRACPVQWTCLTWALQNKVSDGIWGGRTESERRMMLDSMPRLGSRRGVVPMQRIRESA